MSGSADLYDTDFFAWTQQQAALLRDIARQRLNVPLDWDNLVEEVECLGASLRRELHSRLRVLIEHLLKLEHSPATEPRAAWRETIDNQRAEIESLLKQNPSLRREVPEIALDETARAARYAARSLDDRGEAAAAAALRAAGADYTEEQILGDWWPDTGSA